MLVLQLSHGRHTDEDKSGSSTAQAVGPHFIAFSREQSVAAFGLLATSPMIASHARSLVSRSGPPIELDETRRSMCVACRHDFNAEQRVSSLNNQRQRAVAHEAPKAEYTLHELIFNAPMHQLKGMTAACELLPARLLLSIVSLAQPSSIIPSASLGPHAICTAGHSISVAWRNGILFSDRFSRQPAVRYPKDPGQQPSLSDSSSSSNVARMLRDLDQHYSSDQAHLTGCSTQFAPSRSYFPDIVFARAYLHWFLATQLNRANVTKPSHCANEPSHFSWWRPATDVLLLSIYFILRGQVDLLSDCLKLMRKHSNDNCGLQVFRHICKRVDYKLLEVGLGSQLDAQRKLWYVTCRK
ncbi:hypothetical protein BCR44DRAFT_296906 [Catenaria anguillulae PL171]|uniref:Uncharacterized protein n=1 Tax=Catenaria anguillulae PL171 TaxID=765915 RepID=A0A1Y2HIB2_9FUNG|nr:hypothetical protein BCR44DRAFT_296906 [Catenaria anguillulae PL171]